MFKFTQCIIVRSSKNNLFGLSRLNYSAAPTSVEYKSTPGDDTETNQVGKVRQNVRPNSIVAAAFASLSAENKPGNEIQTPFTDDRILKAKNINELLSISEGNGVSRTHALKVVSMLADWSANGKVALQDFESDPRFIKLCKVLTKGSYTKYSRANGATTSRSEDLNTIMNVTADDEAAKLVASITLPQMVKVMQTLAQKKRRSTTLLRSLAFNITRSTDKLDLKQCADLLYSITVLNFPDDNLLERVGGDIIAALNDNLKKSAVVGSIATSLGLLRYKDTVGVLDALSEWILKNHDICRPQDTFALFLTLGVLNYEPENAEKLFEVLIPQLSPTDAVKPSIWLDFVWSLVLLNKATPELISSVLLEKFIGELDADNSLNIPTKLKMLNINAAATSLQKDYSGPTFESGSQILQTPLARTKEKEEMAASVLDALKNLMQSETYIRSNVNAGIGFTIDAECALDKKCIPIAVDKTTNNSEAIKVAIIVQDYHDICRGRGGPSGLQSFATRLLEARGYRILHVPHFDYKVRDKLINRVQYLETKLKALVK